MNWLSTRGIYDMLLYKINLLRYDNLCWYNQLLKTSNSHSLINDSPGTVAFTSHIVPADRSAHCLSLAKKVNAPLKREGGCAGLSIDWCITISKILNIKND